MDKEEIKRERERAWVGDAVLALFARTLVLKERKCMDGEWFTALTSNEFLSKFGQPTSIEAQIGTRYKEEGLEAAFEWIEETLVPEFRRVISRRK